MRWYSVLFLLTFVGGFFIMRWVFRKEGKPEHVVDRIIAGRLEKFYNETCLMEQPFVKDEDRTILDLVNDTIAKLGENIVLRRFVRYEVGEGLE